MLISITRCPPVGYDQTRQIRDFPGFLCVVDQDIAWLLNELKIEFSVEN